MTATARPALAAAAARSRARRRTWEERMADHNSGLRYVEPLGPALPPLNPAAQRYLRDDLLARAAGAEKQADDAWAAGNPQLGQRCGGIADACRDFAKQTVTYALDPAWGVHEVSR
jgi:hypothetical protein